MSEDGKATISTVFNFRKAFISEMGKWIELDEYRIHPGKNRRHKVVFALLLFPRHCLAHEVFRIFFIRINLSGEKQGLERQGLGPRSSLQLLPLRGSHHV